MKQPFGSKVREALADRIKGKDVRVEWNALLLTAVLADPQGEPAL